MPAYNAGKYIQTAIESIISQTYKDWELIICDDRSTDNTTKIVETFCVNDKRIKLIKRDENSGAARLPRREAALAATGYFIMTFDADDFLDNNYVEKMHNRIKDTGADIVLSRLSFCDKTGKEQNRFLPTKDFDYSVVINGKEAVKRTLGKLSISVSGLLINKDIYIANILCAEDSTNCCSYADEIDQRKLLMLCKNVAFVNTNYYYRQQPNSLMHNTNAKRYDFLTSLENIYNFAKENFTEEEVFNKLDNEFLTNLLFCQRDYYLYNHNKLKEAKEILERLKSAYSFAKAEKMSACNLKQKICMLSFPIFQTISYIYSIFLKNK